MHANRGYRNGFTLIELLVVMGLIAVLAALAILFFPSAASSAREARAGADLQGWLTIAKQRALRDQRQGGLRLYFAPFTSGVTTLPWAVTECQYLEQPDDFSAGTINTAGAALDVLSFNLPAGTDLVNGYYTPPGVLNPAEAPLWLVQPGDYIEVLGSGLMHQILPISGANPTGGILDPGTIRIFPLLANAITTPTANYRIVRAPRPIGDETLKLPTDTIVDLKTNLPQALGGVDVVGNPLPWIFTDAPTNSTGYVDVIFSPTGEVVSPGVAASNLHFWVRWPDSSDATNPFRGTPTIVSVFTRTGFVGAYEVSQSATPYMLVK